MGLGLHGGGLSAVNWLVKQGAKVTVTDLKNSKQLESSLKKINSKKVKLVLGGHKNRDFTDADMIVQNPGVPRESEFLKMAQEAGVEIENEASIFFKNCPAKIIGVTGTRGKSTTSTLIYEILRLGNKKVWLAGQPQKPMLDIIDRVKADDLVVLELSSWQLEVLGTQRISPHIAVVTNVYPDHLNRYRSLADYSAAKENIFLHQNQDDICVLNLDNIDTGKMGKKVVSHRFWFSLRSFSEQNGSFVRNQKIWFRFNGQEKLICSVGDVKLSGQHNLSNVLAAVGVSGICGLSSDKIKKAVNKFSGLPYRLELVRDLRGIKYINDTTATTPDGTMAALKALGNNKIILIAGGDFKNIPNQKYAELAKLINKHCQAVILFSGRGSQQLIPYLVKLKFRPLITEIDKMTNAIALANSLAQKSNTILLSPACASFNLFINEYDRGDQFNQIVKSLK